MLMWTSLRMISSIIQCRFLTLECEVHVVTGEGLRMPRICIWSHEQLEYIARLNILPRGVGVVLIAVVGSSNLCTDQCGSNKISMPICCNSFASTTEAMSHRRTQQSSPNQYDAATFRSNIVQCSIRVFHCVCLSIHVCTIT